MGCLSVNKLYPVKYHPCTAQCWDTKTAPQLEEIVSNSLDGVKLLIMDFEEVEYISSAGLRVLLIAQKTMNKQGDMKVNNVNTDIMEIFEVTGFSDILTIE